MSKQIDLVIDQPTLDLMEALKPALGARSTADVLRKSLALAKIVADKAKDGDGVVTMLGADRPEVEAVHLNVLH